MRCKVLVVDDEHDIADLLEVYLQNEDYIVYKFYSAVEALDCIEKEEIDLAILDIMLPDINGFSLCQKIRKEHTYPIIMLTAKDEEMDKITGLTLGADDYVTKPFRPLELIARVKAQLRRYKKYSTIPSEQDYSEILTYKKLALNTKNYECSLDCQTAHCGRCKPHFDFGDNTFPIVPYRHLPQTLIGMTADCRSLV